MNTDYVIEIYGPQKSCWFGGFSDEDDDEEPLGLNITSDPTLAARYSSFKEARVDVLKLMRLHPANSFRVGDLAPLNRVNPV